MAWVLTLNLVATAVATPLAGGWPRNLAGAVS